VATAALHGTYDPNNLASYDFSTEPKARWSTQFVFRIQHEWGW